LRPIVRKKNSLLGRIKIDNLYDDGYLTISISNASTATTTSDDVGSPISVQAATAWALADYNAENVVPTTAIVTQYFSTFVAPDFQGVYWYQANGTWITESVDYQADLEGSIEYVGQPFFSI